MTKDSPPCKVHAVHLCFGSSNCFRPSLTVVPSQDWEGSCLAKGAAAALQCALLFSCLRTSGAAATFFAYIYIYQLYLLYLRQGPFDLYNLFFSGAQSDFSQASEQRSLPVALHGIDVQRIQHCLGSVEAINSTPPTSKTAVSGPGPVSPSSSKQEEAKRYKKMYKSDKHCNGKMHKGKTKQR